VHVPTREAVSLRPKLGAYLGWIRREIHEWVGGPIFAGPLRILTAELLRDGAVAGSRVHEVVHQTQAEVREELESGTHEH
jgi:hypothetical protein